MRRTVSHHGIWFAFFAALTITQVAHLGEHVAQMTQIHVLDEAPPDAHGIVGQLDIEWVHFIWNSVVLAGVALLLFHFRSNPWLWLTLAIAGWHWGEHLAIMTVFWDTGVPGDPGLLAAGGALAGGLSVTRPDLHFLYNIVETAPLVLAFVYALRRSPDVWLPRALPTLVAAVTVAVLGHTAAGGSVDTAAAASVPTAPTRTHAWIARVVAPTVARAHPARGQRVHRVRTQARWNGGPVKLLVLGSRVASNGRRWLRVALPWRPNGTSGWIRADVIRLTRTPWRVKVSLRHRRVKLLRAGRKVSAWEAVIGAPATPTPKGLFAISERIRQPDSNGFLGSWVMTLTAFSNVLKSYGGGPGQVAIHGRGGASFDAPLGSASSHGCVRVNNSVIERIKRVAREGTPVRIVH